MIGEASGSVEDVGRNPERWDANQEEDPARRPQADPLPRKRGEIGYDEALHGQLEGSPTSVQGTGLPERHPADRSAPDSPTTPVTTPDSAAPLATEHVSPQDNTASDQASAHSSGKKSFISFLTPKKLPKVLGVEFATFTRLLVHLICISGTIAAWILVVQRIPPPPDNSIGLSTTQIFVHVTFVVAILMQLVFLERIVFRFRAERYAFKHPGEVLPTARYRGAHGQNPSMGFAPWNRPPLPTYAAALAASGHGTGDVEDNVIAVPPPPAYGNTRGSTLLLAGLMPENLRAQRVRERVRSGETIRSSWVSRLSRITSMTGRPSRPVSYRSHDSAWEERLDADRAIVLGETLARLEEGKRETNARGEGNRS